MKARVPKRRMVWMLALAATLGCGDDDAFDADSGGGGGDAGVDAHVADVGPGTDAGADGGADAGTDGGATHDGGADASTDADRLDAPAETGFGTVAGPCGMIAAEVDRATPSYFVTRLDFMDDGFDPDEDPSDYDRLTPGGQEILDDGGLSSSSLVSEVFAYEVLARCQGATLLKTETEIAYDTEGKKTDILVSMDAPESGEVRVGVSVVRAVRFPPDSPYDPAEARRVIGDKMRDVLESSMNVAESDRWVKQILVVMAYADMHAESVRTAWEGFDAEVRADTIVYVVITDGDDESLYF